MFKNKPNLAGFIVTGLLVLACFSPAQAGVYKCKDAQGRTFYQDKPCQDLITTTLPSWMTQLSGREEERAFLWKAVGEKGSLYLLGTLRYGTQSLYPLPQIVMDTFGTAQVVVVEADLWNQGDKERSALLRDKGHYEDKSSLQDHIKQVTWAKAVEMGKKLGVNEEILRQYKPWLAALILSAESLKQAGYTPDLGIDQTFIREAQGKKPVMEMESIEEQIKMLEEFPDREQEQMLLQILADLGRGPEYYKNMADAWKKGDAEAMDQITRQSYDDGEMSSKLYKAFYEDRNERMANRLAEMANDNKIYFVVLGAGHLGGDKGILKLLEDKGFKVTQP